MTQEALKLALEKIATVNAMDYEYQAWAREALAQTEQEPVVHDPLPRACNLAGVDYQTFLKIKAYMPITPPQRTWVGLTDEDRYEFAAAQYSWEELLIAAEAKLKEKNT